MPKEFDPRVTAYVRANLPSRLKPTLTLKQQAAIVGVSDATLHGVLNANATIGKETMPFFAKALGLTTETLIAEARKQAPPPAASTPDDQIPDKTVALIDTLRMADLAAKDLTDLDKVQPQKAWAVMRGIRLASPSSREFYAEARRRLDAERGASASPTTISTSRKRSASRKAKELFEGADNGGRLERDRAQK